MRDLAQAEALGVDTSDMVVVTHPDKKARYGGGPARFTMTRLAFVKRGLEARGFRIEGEANHAAQPTAREQSLMAEVEQLRAQVAAGKTDPDRETTGRDREVLEAEAADLGIKIHHNMKDETLAKKIAEARAVQDLDDEDFD